MCNYYRLLGRYDDAMEASQRSIELSKAIHGEDSPKMAGCVPFFQQLGAEDNVPSRDHFNLGNILLAQETRRSL
jgi:hypothetical protein